MSHFVRERETFRRLLPGLLADPITAAGFALVHGDELAGVYPTFDAALDAGYDRYGLGVFMVRQVTPPERPPYFSRNIAPCPSPRAD